MDTKVCTKCRLEKDITDFYELLKNSDGRHSWCKECSHELNRQRRKKNPEISRNNNLKALYGITLDDYGDMFLKQNGRCAICRKTRSQNKGMRLVVDHCHATGKVRGLLCSRCNTMLGHSLDNPDTLKSAAAYLEYHAKPETDSSGS